MSVKRKTIKTGRPVKVPGEKDTKEKIFDAAVDLFAEKGYDRVSIRDIARAVGITEGAVYKHYLSKEAILESIFAFVEGRIYPAMPEDSYNAMIEASSFRQILESMPRYMMADRSLARVTRIMLIEMYHNDKIRDYVRRELFQRPVDETEGLFKKLMENGKIRQCDARALSTMFISYLVYWYIEVFVFSYGAATDNARIEKELRAQIDLIIDLASPARKE